MEYITLYILFHNIYFYFRLSMEEDHLIWFEDHLKIKNGGSKSSQDQDPFEGIT